MPEAADARPIRCHWVRLGNPLYVRYHDEEWGVPCTDEVRLFEMLNLEGAQAGLSWETILNKREAYRRAFDSWDADRVARYDDGDLERLLADAGIVRNRLKLSAAIANARAYLALRDETGGLVPYLWGWVGGVPIVHDRDPDERAPARTELSDTISHDLALRGFRFVGSTIVYAYLQATGVVDDHASDCFCHRRRRPPDTDERVNDGARATDRRSDETARP